MFIGEVPFAGLFGGLSTTHLKVVDVWLEIFFLDIGTNLLAWILLCLCIRILSFSKWY